MSWCRRGAFKLTRRLQDGAGRTRIWKGANDTEVRQERQGENGPPEDSFPLQALTERSKEEEKGKLDTP